jgi:hypothetical protein
MVIDQDGETAAKVGIDGRRHVADLSKQGVP